MRTILAIDPGVSTGICLGYYGSFMEGMTLDILDQKTFTIQDEIAKVPLHLYAYVTSLIQAVEPSNLTIIYEAFTIMGAREDSSNRAMEIIGVIKYLCSLERKIKLVSSNSINQHSVETRFRNYHKNFPANTPHELSALKHMLFHTVVSNPITRFNLNFKQSNKKIEIDIFSEDFS